MRIERQRVTNRLHRLVRWAWWKLTGEDPAVVSNHFHDLAGLNVIHVAFLERLERDHPELSAEISAHQKERFASLHTPNIALSGANGAKAE